MINLNTCEEETHYNLFMTVFQIPSVTKLKL